MKRAPPPSLRWRVLHGLILAAACVAAVVAHGQGAGEAVPPNGRPCGDGAAPSSSGNLAVPAASAPSAPSGASAAAAAPVAPALRTGPALRLRQADGRLPRVVPGQAWRSVPLLTGGLPRYECRLLTGEWPVGLHFDGKTGQLQAAPGFAPRDGTRFTVELSDSAQPPQRLRQELVLSVGPALPPKPVSLVASQPAALALPEPPAANGHVVYRVTLADLEAVLPLPAEPAAAPAPEAGAKPAAAAEEMELTFSAEQLQVLLTELGLPAGTLPRRPGATGGTAAGGATTASTAASSAGAASAAGKPAAVAPAFELPDVKDPAFVIVQPLLDIEYPTASLLASAIRARQCEVFRVLWASHVAAQAKKGRRLGGPGSCEWPARGLAGLPAGADAAAAALFHKLLDDKALLALVGKALKVYAPGLTPRQAWQEPRCGCVPPMKDDLLIAFYPPWHARQPPPKLDFASFHRASIMGPRLTDDGRLLEPDGWRTDTAAMARLARRHGTRLDLVVHRHDWPGVNPADALPAGTPVKVVQETRARFEARVKAAAEQGAAATMALANYAEPQSGWQLRPFLFGWDEPPFTFEGVTLLFDNLPRSPDGRLAPLFSVYFDGFVNELVRLMSPREAAAPPPSTAPQAQASAPAGGADGARALGHLPTPTRAYALNIVLADEWVGSEGPFELEAMMQLVERAEREDGTHIPEGANRSLYTGRGDIRVRFIVPIREPTTHYKKRLRERIDRSETVTGHRRVALLNAIVPMIFAPAAAVPLPAPEATRAAASAAAAGVAKPAPPPAPALWAPAAKQQVDDDIAYYKWSFGGVAFWTQPEAGVDAGDQVRELLRDNYRVLDADGLSDQLCDWVCPRRQAVRFTFEVLLLGAAAAVVLLLLAAWPRRLGRSYLAAMWLLVFLAVVVGAALLGCDPTPAIQRAREGNQILLMVTFVLMVGGLWFSFKPRYPRP